MASANWVRGFQENHDGLVVLKPIVPEARLAPLRVPEPGNRYESKWTHFSVWQDQAHRLAAVVAFNTFANDPHDWPGSGEDRTYDAHFDKAVQLPERGYYQEVGVDYYGYGHLAMRDQLAWGSLNRQGEPNLDEANAASTESYYYTNIAPQHNRGLNQDEWLGLEKWQQKGLGVLRPEDRRIPQSTFVGPIWNGPYPERRKIGNANMELVEVPRGFFRIVVTKLSDGNDVQAYVFSHSILVDRLSGASSFRQNVRLFRSTVSYITTLTGIEFPGLEDASPVAEEIPTLPQGDLPVVPVLPVIYGALVNPAGSDEREREYVCVDLKQENIESLDSLSLELRFKDRSTKLTRELNPARYGSNGNVWKFHPKLQLANRGGEIRLFRDGVIIDQVLYQRRDAQEGRFVSFV